MPSRGLGDVYKRQRWWREGRAADVERESVDSAALLGTLVEQGLAVVGGHLGRGLGDVLLRVPLRRLLVGGARGRGLLRIGEG